MPGLVDVILGYDCNLACDYCTITTQMRSHALPAAQIVKYMRDGRARGYDRVAFTGGEPTIRPDLVGLLKAAHKLGFEDIKVQSNGLLFTEANVARLVSAGATRLHISIHTHEAEAYDALVRREGAYPLMLQGLRNALASGAHVVVDVIIKHDTYRRLPAATRWLAQLGVPEVHLWYVSLTDNNAAHPESLPPMREAIPLMRESFAIARAKGIDMKSLHVPRCLLGEDAKHAWDPGSQRVIVVTPDSSFELKDSRLAGQHHVPACAGCEHEALCPGVRPDYVARFGDGEIASARGQAPSIEGAVRLPLLS